MPALPRGRCPICGAFVALRKGDLVREHRALIRDGSALSKRVCPGSGQKKAP